MAPWTPLGPIDRPLPGCVRTAQLVLFLAYLAPSSVSLFGTDDALYNGEECPGFAPREQSIDNPAPRIWRWWTCSGERTTIRHSELECSIAGRDDLVVILPGWFFRSSGFSPWKPRWGSPIGETGPNRITTAVAKRFFEVMVSRIDIVCGLTSSPSVASQIHLADCRCMERSSNE